MNQRIRILAFVIFNGLVLIIGATIFMYIEYHYTEKAPDKNLTLLKKQIEFHLDSKFNKTAFDSILKHVDEYIHTDKICKARKYEAGWKKQISARTFVRWCYFAYTIVTTIGYGDIVVESEAGKLFLGVFAMLAIPIHMYSSYLVGRVITWLLKKLLYSIEINILQHRKVKHRSAKVLVMSLLLSFIWTIICGGLIIANSGWTMTDAVYFAVVSMLTIGFGDLTIDLFEIKPLPMFLSLHLYVGMSMLASVLNGFVTFMKKEDKRDEYTLSKGENVIPVARTDRYTVKGSFQNPIFVKSFLEHKCKNGKIDLEKDRPLPISESSNGISHQ